ncbi:ParA family protein [[Mycoplasma] collis]|uniref:ParA family protein n=1 Tax=[Mycoplasma] collis TaxID=2127 RepID=UPI00051BB2D8|nr:ParA family protein [[Mycoplasma] collis]
MAIKIAFVNNKGGVLKTTLTLNYAAVLAKKGYKVLIIDTDSQSNIASGFGIKKQVRNYTLHDLVFYFKNPLEAPIKVYENIDIVLPGDSWRFFEEEISKRSIYGDEWRNLKEIIAEYENQYDYILFDTEPKKGANVLSILLVSDDLIIPFTLDAFGIEGLSKMHYFIKQAQNKNKKLKIKALVATKTIKRNITEAAIKSQADKFFAPGLCPISIPSSVHDARAITFNKLPIYLTNLNKQQSQVYEKLVDLLEFNKKEKNNE